MTDNKENKETLKVIGVGGGHPCVLTRNNNADGIWYLWAKHYLHNLNLNKNSCVYVAVAARAVPTATP